MSYNPNNPNGQATMANSSPVTIASNQSTLPVSAGSLPLPSGAATSALQTQPGVDIGDVTINNASGASAVNIQDGGNSITVDGSVSISGTVTTTGGLTDSQLRATPVPVSGTVTAANASVSTTGSTVPASATMIGGSDGTNLKAVKVSSTGVVSVDGSATTQPVSLATNTPTIQAGSSIIGKVGIDQTTPGTTNKVSIGTDGTVAINAALPTGSNAIGSITNTAFGVNNASGASAVNIQDGGNSITVDGTVAATQSGTWNVTNVSGTVSLPTGASTETTLSTLNTKFPTAAALADAIANPTTHITGSALLGFNGTTWDRIRTDGTDNDADPVATTGILSVEAHGQSFNGTNWDRVRTAGIGNNVVSTGLQIGAAYGQYNATLPTLTDTRYTSLQTDINGNLKITGGDYPTYAASAKAIVPIASTTQPTFSIQGSASKTIKITKMSISVSATTGTALPTSVSLQRYSSITGGTPVAITAGLYDTANAAATAVIQNWTAAPTIVAVGGPLASQRLNWTTAGATVGNTTMYKAEFTFGNVNSTQELTLRGTAQWVGLLLTAVGTTPVADIYVEWVEV